MYQITCDGKVLHDSRLDKNYRVLDPILKLKLNTVGTLNFKILPTHPYYDSIQKLKSEITVTQDGEWMFTGRVLNDEKDFRRIKSIEVEGELGYLLDSNQRVDEIHNMSVANYFKMIVDKHNAMVEPKKQFQVGIVNVVDNNDSLYRFSNYENTWDTIKDKLIKRLGGYIRVRHENGVKYIDYVKDYGRVNTQVIRFGENLIDLKQYVKGENVATAIIPLGAELNAVDTPQPAGGQSAVEKHERLTIREVNGGLDYVFDQEAVDLYGWIFDIVTYNDVTVAENLKRKAQQDLAQRRLLEHKLELNAVDLHLVNVDVDKIKVGDSIKVSTKPHNIDTYMTVSELTINMQYPDKTKIVLGQTVKSLTDFTNKDDLNEIVENIVDNTGIKDGVDSIRKHVNELSSTITQTAQDIILRVESNTQSIDGVMEELKTQVKLLNNSIEFNFNSAITESNKVGNQVIQNQQLLEEYIRFKGALIELGKIGNSFVAKLSNEKLAFLQDNVEIAYISNNKLYITDAEIKNKLTLGNPTNGYFDFIPRANGNLSLVWRDK